MALRAERGTKRKKKMVVGGREGRKQQQRWGVYGRAFAVVCFFVLVLFLAKVGGVEWVG